MRHARTLLLFHYDSALFLIALSLSPLFHISLHVCLSHDRENGSQLRLIKVKLMFFDLCFLLPLGETFLIENGFVFVDLNKISIVVVGLRQGSLIQLGKLDIVQTGLTRLSNGKCSCKTRKLRYCVVGKS